MSFAGKSPNFVIAGKHPGLNNNNNIEHNRYYAKKTKKKRLYRFSFANHLLFFRCFFLGGGGGNIKRSFGTSGTMDPFREFPEKIRKVGHPEYFKEKREVGIGRRVRV